MMKKKLDDLTIGQFIDIVCGQVDGILSKNDIAGGYGKALSVRNLIMEYREIADPAGAKQYLSIIEDMIKASMEVMLFSMCANLVDMNEEEHVYGVLAAFGINVKGMSAQRVVAEVKSRLERAKSKLDKIQNERDEAPEATFIRRQFDEQTAAMMAHFKFQIDITSMKATVYAHLVARHNREVKARLAALKKK